jgi:RimJ/RimL family protein N-acetyltransferase
MKFRDMKIEMLKPKDVVRASRFTQDIINSLTIYNRQARDAFSKEMSPNRMRKELKRGKLFVMKTKSGKILGFSNYYPSSSGVGLSDWLLIDSSSRGKGLGIALSKYILAFAKRHGEHTVLIDSRINNHKSIKMIKKLGFSKLGLFRKAWYKQDYYLWYKNI